MIFRLIAEKVLAETNLLKLMHVGHGDFVFRCVIDRAAILLFKQKTATQINTLTPDTDIGTHQL